MKKASLSRWITLSVVMTAFIVGNYPKSVDAQVIQLPTIRFFNVRTTVSVPDGGTINLGGVNRNSARSVNRGLPGARGPLFGNRGIGQNAGASRASVSAKLIVMSEYEEAVLMEAARRRKLAEKNDRNGPPEVQQKADFITRNIGRSRKR